MADSYWQNRTFVVTGGARGQGAAEANTLMARGANVVIVDPVARDSADWGIAPGTSAQWRAIAGGVEKEETWQDVLSAASEFSGPLAGLVNNAGISLRKTVTQTALAEWERVLAINLTGAFLGIRHVGPKLADGGAIVNVSSTAGVTGYFSAAYTASKWGLRGLSKAAAIELASRQITVNTVCPGAIDTPMNNRPAGGYNEEQAKLFFELNQKMTPLSRGGKPQEIADLVLFLLGPESRFITGTDIIADGGMVGGGMYCSMGRAVGTVPA